MSAVLTDSAGYVLGSSNPIPVDPSESGASFFDYQQVSVTNSATQLLSANTTRRAALVTNNDASTACFIGDASVTSSTGHKLAAGASLTIPFTGAIYAITASSTITVSASEVYD